MRNLTTAQRRGFDSSDGEGCYVVEITGTRLSTEYLTTAGVNINGLPPGQTFGVLDSVSSTGQKIDPIECTSSRANFTFSVYKPYWDQLIQDPFSQNFNNWLITIWYGKTSMPFSDFVAIQTALMKNASVDRGESVSIDLSDPRERLDDTDVNITNYTIAKHPAQAILHVLNDKLGSLNISIATGLFTDYEDGRKSHYIAHANYATNFTSSPSGTAVAFTERDDETVSANSYIQECCKILGAVLVNSGTELVLRELNYTAPAIDTINEDDAEFRVLNHSENLYNRIVVNFNQKCVSKQNIAFENAASIALYGEKELEITTDLINAESEFPFNAVPLATLPLTWVQLSVLGAGFCSLGYDGTFLDFRAGGPTPGNPTFVNQAAGAGLGYGPGYIVGGTGLTREQYIMLVREPQQGAPPGIGSTSNAYQEIISVSEHHVHAGSFSYTPDDTYGVHEVLLNPVSIKSFNVLNRALFGTSPEVWGLSTPISMRTDRFYGVDVTIPLIMARERLQQFAFGAQVIEAVVSINRFIHLEVTDIVNVVSRKPVWRDGSLEGSTSSDRWMILEITYNWPDGTMRLVLMRCVNNTDIPVVTITPTPPTNVGVSQSALSAQSGPATSTTDDFDGSLAINGLTAASSADLAIVAVGDNSRLLLEIDILGDEEVGRELVQIYASGGSLTSYNISQNSGAVSYTIGVTDNGDSTATVSLTNDSASAQSWLVRVRNRAFIVN